MTNASRPRLRVLARCMNTRRRTWLFALFAVAPSQAWAQEAPTPPPAARPGTTGDVAAAAAATTRAAEDTNEASAKTVEAAKEVEAKAAASKTAKQLEVEEAVAEEKADKVAKVATFGNEGISVDPQWDVLAGAAISTMETTQPQAGLGLQYNSSKYLLRLVVRRNLAGSSISGTPGEDVFGHAALNPALGEFSASLRGEIGLGTPWIGLKRIARGGFRAYADFAVARDKLELNNTDSDGEKQTLRKLAVPLAVAGGLAFKIDGVMPEKRKFGGSQLLMLEVYAGPSWRVFGGDWNAAQRTLLWDKHHDGRNFFGAEVGAFLQFGSILLEPKFTWLGVTDGGQPSGYRDSRVNGLTSCQFDMKVAFFVPWTVVGNSTPPDYVAEDQKKAADAAAEAAASELDAKQTEAQTLNTKAKTEAIDKALKK